MVKYRYIINKKFTIIFDKKENITYKNVKHVLEAERGGRYIGVKTLRDIINVEHGRFDDAEILFDTDNPDGWNMNNLKEISGSNISGLDDDEETIILLKNIPYNEEYRNYFFIKEDTDEFNDYE